MGAVLSAVADTRTAFDRVVDGLDAAGCRVTVRGGGRAQAQCPAHEDRDPSLSLTKIEGQVLVHCHAGCDIADVVASLGLTMAGLYDETAGVSYRYTDLAGVLQRTVIRTPDKRFRQSVHTTGPSTTLYRLPAVVEAAAAGKPVYLVEGEKDVHALEAVGAVATTAPMGAGNWEKVDATPLHGVDVVAIVDDDDAGARWAAAVLESLDGLARSLQFVRAAVGKDAADHVAAGRSLDQLVAVDLDGAAAAFSRAVDLEAHRLRVRDAAALKVRQERAGALGAVDLVRLDTFLAVEDEPTCYRITELLPVGGRVVLAAQYKAGKSTMLGNLVRSLADGDPFLDAFGVELPAGGVALVDDELDERMLRRWLRDQHIAARDRVHLVALRGRTGAFDLLDDVTRGEWADRIRATGATVLVLDCLRPVLDALGLSEDKDAGRFLVALDALLAEAGISEAVVSHHMGHTGERSRGDTRIRDWPDVEWRLVREASEDGSSNPDARRYFTAYGRDVDVREGLLTYDTLTRRLVRAGGSRIEVRADGAWPEIREVLEQHPEGLTGRAVERLLEHSEHGRDSRRLALRRAVEQGSVDVMDGPNRSRLHTLSARVRGGARAVRENTDGWCAGAPIGAHRAHTPQSEQSSARPAHLLICSVCGEELDPVHARTGTHPPCDPDAQWSG